MSLIKEFENAIKNKDFGNFEEINKNLNPYETKECFMFLYEHTNSFKNTNTTPEILLIAGKLLEHGIDHDKLIVSKTKKSLNQMKFCSEVIKEVKLYKENKIAGVIIKNSLLERFGEKSGGISSSFIKNILITIEAIDFCFIIIEKNPGEIEILIASKNEKNPKYLEIKEKLKIKEEAKKLKSKTTEEILELILEN